MTATNGFPRLKVEQKLMQEALSDRRGVLVVRVDAVAPDSRNFSRKDYYTRALVALEESLSDDKFDYREYRYVSQPNRLNSRVTSNLHNTNANGCDTLCGLELQRYG
jgi:hypothetical protein